MRAHRAAWRLIVEGDLDGAANMACDEALLASAEQMAPPTLRLYGWSRPTLSLGAHQSGSDADLNACRRMGVDLVRRPTGGGAVLHDVELTYAVVGRLGEDPVPASVVGVYDKIAACLVAGFSLLGLETLAEAGGGRGRPAADCFARAGSREIVAGGRKLVGSAQLRRRGVFLQHGSILIAHDAARLRTVLRPGTALEAQVVGSAGGADGRGAHARSPGPATLVELMGRRPARGEIEEAIAEGFRRVLGAPVDAQRLTTAEEESAARLRATKYLDARWTLEGKLRTADQLR